MVATVWLAATIAFDTALQKRFLLQKSTQGFLLGMLVSFSQPASIELKFSVD
jgi:hypothetical protein